MLLPHGFALSPPAARSPPPEHCSKVTPAHPSALAQRLSPRTHDTSQIRLSYLACLCLEFIEGRDFACFLITMSLEPGTVHGTKEHLENIYAIFILIFIEGQISQARTIPSFQAAATLNPRTSPWKGNESNLAQTQKAFSQCRAHHSLYTTPTTGNSPLRK